MKLPKEVQSLLQQKYQRHRGNWLIADSQWSLTVSLGVPTEKTAQLHYRNVHAWVVKWQQWQGFGELSWCQRNWRVLGKQQLPEKITFYDPVEVADWLGETTRWRRARDRFKQLILYWPILTKILSRFFDVLADYDEIDFSRLIDLLKWLIDYPQSNYYPRELPIAGLDSKWLETRKKLITSLFAVLRGINMTDNINFYQCCGLKPLPRLLRIRLLDKNLANRLGGLNDISAPYEQLANLQLPVKRAIIVENLQTGLAFPETTNAVLIMGLGYHVDILAPLMWLQSIPCFYWGDIDTHGFAILNRLRTHLPHVQSVMMDEATLTSHQDLWGEEKHQHGAMVLDNLTTDEQAVYQQLKEQIWQHNLRLEQERIDWNYATEVLLENLNRTHVSPLRMG